MPTLYLPTAIFSIKSRNAIGKQENKIVRAYCCAKKRKNGEKRELLAFLFREKFKLFHRKCATYRLTAAHFIVILHILSWSDSVSPSNSICARFTLTTINCSTRESKQFCPSSPHVLAAISRRSISSRSEPRERLSCQQVRAQQRRYTLSCLDSVIRSIIDRTKGIMVADKSRSVQGKRIEDEGVVSRAAS